MEPTAQGAWSFFMVLKVNNNISKAKIHGSVLTFARILCEVNILMTLRLAHYSLLSGDFHVCIYMKNGNF